MARLLILFVAGLLAWPLGAQEQAPDFVNPYNTCNGHGAHVRVYKDGTVLMIATAVDTLSPEGVAGLRTGDTLIALNGLTLGDPAAAKETFWKYAPGDTNVLRVRGPHGPRTLVYEVGVKVFHDSLSPGTAVPLRERATQCRPAPHAPGPDDTVLSRA